MTTLTTAMARDFGARLIKLTDALDDPAAHARLDALQEWVATGTFQLVVVGEIKKGKSSFINALLGNPDLLPALSDVATSTVYQITWGECLSYRVHFQPEDPSTPAQTKTLAIDASEVATYGTEDGNPNNQRKVDFIAVEVPHPLLKQGLTIVDTPGLGGLFKTHAEILWRYAPAADALFFVLDSVEAVASRPEMEALERLRKMTPLLFFVQTKTDLAPQEQWREWQTRNCAILAETLRIPCETLRYFPLSAKLKLAADRRQSSELLRDSGYEALLDFLQEELMALKDAYRANQFITAITDGALALHQRGAEQVLTLTAKTKEELNALDQNALAARDAFRKWKDSTYQEMKREFERRSKNLKREHSDALKTQLDSDANGPIIGSIMARLDTEQQSADQIVAQLDELRSQVIDRCASEILAIQEAYQRRMQQLISMTTEQMGNALQVTSDDQMQPELTSRGSASVDAQDHLFVRTRTIFRGATTSSAVVGYGLIAVGMVTAPVSLAIAAPLLITAMVAGVYFAHDAIQDKRRVKVLSNLKNVLSENVRVARSQATQQFAELADRLEYAAIDAFNQVIDTRTASLERQIDQIETARRQTSEEKAAQSEHVKLHLETLAAMIKDIDREQQRAPVLTTPTPSVK